LKRSAESPEKNDSGKPQVNDKRENPVHLQGFIEKQPFYAPKELKPML